MPPKQPIQLQPQQPPQWQQPQQPIASQPPPAAPLVPIPPIPPKPEISPGDLAKLIAAELEKQKPKEELSPPAKSEPATVDLDELAKRVAARLPPLYVDKYVDGKKSGDTVTVRLGEVLNLHHGQAAKAK